MRSILRYLGTCDGNMEEGSMRCDCNVSVRMVGEKELRTRCEIKNVNSVRFVMQAIEHEAQRQVDLYENGGQVVQETRLFDANKGTTRTMRSKEEAHDYRYFPDPDLLPLVLLADEVERLRADLPELPDAKKARFIADLGLGAYDASVLVAEKASADYFEEVAAGRDAKTAANWVISNLFGVLNKLDIDIEESPVSATSLGKLIDLITDGTISGRIAKDVFQAMVDSGDDPGAIVEKKGMKQITDAGAIEEAVDAVIADNPDKIAEIRAGKDKMLGWFVGQVMQMTGGKANPKMVNDLLREKTRP
jgi:aspartyl-tRNA(Asn)/glutamyl-tRNA(Gln) amidotransferase subunit B